MPHVFTHAEYADMVFGYGFCNGNALAACREYSLLFPNRLVPDSRVFASVYNKLCETGRLPSSHISSERANEQNVDEIESILQSVERSPTTSTRRISTRTRIPISVFHIQEYGELYVSTACILFIYRWCNALKKEMKVDDWICVGG